MEVRTHDGSSFNMPDSPLLADILQAKPTSMDMMTIPEQITAAPDVTPEQIARLGGVLIQNS